MRAFEAFGCDRSRCPSRSPNNHEENIRGADLVGQCLRDQDATGDDRRAGLGVATMRETEPSGECRESDNAHGHAERSHIVSSHCRGDPFQRADLTAFSRGGIIMGWSGKGESTVYAVKEAVVR